jgi:hypothetical protein
LKIYSVLDVFMEENVLYSMKNMCKCIVWSGKQMCIFAILLNTIERLPDNQIKPFHDRNAPL